VYTLSLPQEKFFHLLDRSGSIEEEEEDLMFTKTFQDMVKDPL
jgi:hypothetical protein